MKETKKEQVAKYTKEQLKKMEKYSKYIDVIEISLKSDIFYSIEEIEKIIKEFIGGDLC